MAGTSIAAPHPTIANLWVRETLSTDSNLIISGYCTGTPDTTANTYEHGCILTRIDSGAGVNAVYQNTGTSASPVWTLFDTGTAFALPTTATDATSTTTDSFTIVGSALTTGDAIKITSASATTGGGLEIISPSSNTIAVGLTGKTNPAFQVDSSTALSATGLKIKSAAAAGGVALSVVSSGTDESLTIAAKGAGTVSVTSPTIITGTTTNDSAASGKVGEIITSTVAVGSAVSLTTATTANVTSISLTAGDWDVTGVVDWNLTGATTTDWSYGVSTTTATLGAQDTFGKDPIVLTTHTDTYASPCPVTRISVAATTTVYLVANAAFSAGTIGAYGTIRARRVR